MKINRTDPIVRTPRLRQKAEQAGCAGLAALVDVYLKEWREEEKDFDLRVNEILPDEAVHPGAPGAWEELARRFELVVGENYDVGDDDPDDEGCEGMRRAIVLMMELIPSLPYDIRMPIDTVLGHMAEHHPK